MRATLDRAEQELRRFLDQCLERGRHPPPLAELHVGRDHQRPLGLIFTLEFDGAPSLGWIDDGIEVIDAVRSGTVQAFRHCFERELRSSYSRLYEDALIGRETRQAQREFDEFARRCGDPHRIQAARHQLEQRLQHVRRHHRRPPSTMFGLDRGRPGSDLTAVAIRRGAEITMFAYDELASSVDPALYRQLSERVDGQIARAFLMGEWGAPRDNSTAEAKGLALLREWLSPEQLAQYDKSQHFDVLGSASGKRYRIHHGRQQNIKELDKQGRAVCGWCFLPEGQLVAGDVMLGQKIALETNEKRALKVANRFDARDWTVDSRSMNLRPGAVTWVGT